MQEMEKLALTVIWGQLHNQPDTSNIQQRLGATLKPLALETERRESEGHDHKYSLSPGAMCFTLNADTYPQQIIAPYIKY